MWGREESEVGVFYRFLLCHLRLAVTLNGKPWVLLRGSLYMIPDSRVQPPLFWSGVGTALASPFPPPCAFLCEQPFINLFSSYNFIALSVPCQDLGWHNVSIKSLLTFDLIFFLIFKLSSYCSRLKFIATSPVKGTPWVTVPEFLLTPVRHWDVPSRKQESPESMQRCLFRICILDMKDSGTQKVADLLSVTDTLWLLRVRCKIRDPKKLVRS